MPALDEAEARVVIAAIHQRYHRTSDQAVVAALMQKPAAAWSNPLWLYLAVEQVNLLDSDDVVRAEQHYDPAWPMARRLQALLLDRVAAFPADLPGLYRATFDHATLRFPGLAPAFLGLIAVSAAGWRESDFRAVLPGLSGQGWNDLRFAYLRRLFRGQIRPRGALEQWDVAHAQMRVAIRAWLPGQSVTETDLHAAVGRCLLSLPADDPLRETETMRHLLGAGQLAEAATYYADADLPAAATAGATRLSPRLGLRFSPIRRFGRGLPTCWPCPACLRRQSAYWLSAFCSVHTSRLLRPDAWGRFTTCWRWRNLCCSALPPATPETRCGSVISRFPTTRSATF
jgi:hypothetical protein